MKLRNDFFNYDNFKIVKNIKMIDMDTDNEVSIFNEGCCTNILVEVIQEMVTKVVIRRNIVEINGKDVNYPCSETITDIEDNTPIYSNIKDHSSILKIGDEIVIKTEDVDVEPLCPFSILNNMTGKSYYMRYKISHIEK